MTDTIMTMSECADYLRVSYRQMQNLVNSGDIPFYPLGKSKRFSLLRVKEALAAIEHKGNYVN